MAATSSDSEGGARRRARPVVALLAAAGVVLAVSGVLVAEGAGQPDAPTALPSVDRMHQQPGVRPAVRHGVRAAKSEPVTRLKARPTPVALPPPAEPELLTVPRLGIDAPVRFISPAGGVLTPPSDPGEVGWDYHTAKPGAVRGSTVITGHTVHTGGGALDELDDLAGGDVVLLTTATGLVRYRVEQVERISKDDMVGALPRLYDGDVPGRLVLITCTDWNGEVYLGNTVVIARPV